MWSRFLPASFLFALLSSSASVWAASAPITAAEQAWLQAAKPVVAYARQQGLPMDIVVQPQAAPEQSPVAMGLQDGRCKLVFSMRGNPSVDELVAGMPEGLFVPIAEAVIAHEVAHCWRRVQGAWATLPGGVADTAESAPDNQRVAELKREMRETRREEGFADLFGLAWTQAQHPEHYARVQTWLAATRDDITLEGEHHDTRVWVRLARQASVFTPQATLFEQANTVWAVGLQMDGAATH